MNNGEYVFPKLKKFKSFDSLINPESNDFDFSFYDKKNKIKMEDLFNIDQCFVLGEPGYGKSRLLKEIILRANDHNKNAFYIDLKKLKGDFYNKINKYINQTDNVQSNEIENIDELKLIKSSDFKLKNSDNIVICFDGLDEVTQGEEFSNIVENIKIFIKDYDKCNVFISCRTHQYRKYFKLFNDIESTYIKIEPFSPEQVYEYLNNYGLSNEDKERLLDNVSFQNRNMIIQVPRYLMMLGNLIKDKDIDYVIDLNIPQLFEKFIYLKLEEEGKKENLIGVNKTELIKRVLEKLALIMEIYQTNNISKDELISFFDEVKSNLNINFLQQVSLNELYNRTVLKDNIDSIEFENTEFQEYLAAKEIIRIGKQNQILFDLSVEQQTREIFPSWFNTIRFLLNLDIGLLRPILEFGNYDTENLKDPEYHKLLSTTNIEKLTKIDKFDIFSNIFLYYQNISHYIDINLAKNLSFYFDQEHLDLIQSSIDPQKYRDEFLYIRESNSCRILSILIERNLLKSKQINYWKNKFISIIKRENKNEVLVRSCLYFFKNLKDLNVLKQIKQFIDLKQQLIQDTFINACINCNPNDDFTVNVFIDATKWKNIYSRYGLYKVKDKKYILMYLGQLINDEEFLIHFIDYEDIFPEKDHILIDNIKNIYDKSVEAKLKELIIYSVTNKYYYKCENSKFFKGISKLVNENDNNLVFEILNKLISLKDNFGYFFHSEDLFSILLEKSQVQKYVESLIKVEKGTDFVFSVLYKIKNSKRDNSNIIYEEGRKYLHDIYNYYDELFTKRKRKYNRDNENRIIGIYKHFQFLLEPEPKKYIDSVFGYYIQHRNDLKNKIKQKDIDRLIYLVKNEVLKKINPLDQYLKNKSKSNGRSHFTTTNLVIMFRYCLGIVQELQIDIRKYRQNILNFIPFATEEFLQIIFKLIPDPSNNELNGLFSVYDGSRTDDLSIHLPSSIISTIKNYNLKEGVKILHYLIDNDQLSLHDRLTAFETINYLNPDEKYNIKNFNKYSKDKGTELFQFSEKANEFLIRNFSNENAIKWRFKEIKNRVVNFKIQIGKVGSYSREEGELTDKEFSKPIMELKDLRYRNLFYDLLDHSFKIYEKGEDYYLYCQYLWDIVIAYFSNLRENKSINILIDLENYINKKSQVYGINWFRKKLIDLKRHYLLYIGKPVTIMDCIKQYNKTKAKQYLDITSSYDLKNIIEEVIENDLKKFVESEGFYKTVHMVKGEQEELIQKTIKTQFENAFLKRGFREFEINIQREEQLLDDKRTDFLLSYGLISPILIELKRLDNKEITNNSERKNYRKKLLQYIEGYKCQYGVFFILRIKEKPTIDEMKSKLNSVYEHDKNISVKYLDCLKN